MALKDAAYIGTEVGRLADNLLDFCATRGFQDFEVTLPETANTAFELTHTLKASKPSNVKYQIVQSPFPVIVWHNPDDAWDTGLVRLRASANGGTIRIRLSVDEGGLNESLDKPSITGLGGASAYDAGFLIPGAVGSSHVSQNYANNNGADFAAYFDVALNGSHLGPGVYIGEGDYGFIISSDMLNAGVAGPIKKLRFISNVESGTYRFAMQLASVAPTEWHLTPNVNTYLDLGADPLAAAWGPGYQIRDIWMSGASTALGKFTNYTPTFSNAAGGAALGNGTISGRYTHVGRLCNGYLTMTLGATTVTGAGALQWSLPLTAAVGANIVAQARVYNAAAARWYFGSAFLPSTTNIQVLDATTGAVWVPGTPGVWGAGDIVQLQYSYETA
jgi:hypothetical protein